MPGYEKYSPDSGYSSVVGMSEHSIEFLGTTKMEISWLDELLPSSQILCCKETVVWLVSKYSPGSHDIQFYFTASPLRTDFPQPAMEVNCLSDGVQVGINFVEQPDFNGVLYVKGHSKDEQCRRVVTVSKDSPSYKEVFKVNFGRCGLIHVNVCTFFIISTCCKLVLLQLDTFLLLFLNRYDMMWYDMIWYDIYLTAIG